MRTKKTAVVETKAEMVASIEFIVRASLHEDYVDSDFVQSILGRIVARPQDDGDEEDAGYIRASLIQFGEALDHGITTDRLGDGIDGEISEYWERLFDLDTGHWKEEIQDEYEASDCNLLIINCVEVHPKFRGRRIGSSAIDRAIDIFGSGCGLVACKPWPLQFTPAVASDGKTLKTLRAPKLGKDEAILKLRSYCSKLGFWPLGETGIYVLSMAQRISAELPRECNSLAESVPGLVGRRVC
jgi:GNAT superfamily N-acetyltransferase